MLAPSASMTLAGSSLQAVEASLGVQPLGPGFGSVFGVGFLPCSESPAVSAA